MKRFIDVINFLLVGKKHLLKKKDEAIGLLKIINVYKRYKN